MGPVFNFATDSISEDSLLTKPPTRSDPLVESAMVSPNHPLPSNISTSVVTDLAGGSTNIYAQPPTCVELAEETTQSVSDWRLLILPNISTDQSKSAFFVTGKVASKRKAVTSGKPPRTL